MLPPSSEKTQRTNTQWDAEGGVQSEDTQGYFFSMQHWRAVPEPARVPPRELWASWRKFEEKPQEQPEI